MTKAKLLEKLIANWYDAGDNLKGRNISDCTQYYVVVTYIILLCNSWWHWRFFLPLKRYLCQTIFCSLISTLCTNEHVFGRHHWRKRWDSETCSSLATLFTSAWMVRYKMVKEIDMCEWDLSQRFPYLAIHNYMTLVHDCEGHHYLSLHACTFEE